MTVVGIEGQVSRRILGYLGEEGHRWKEEDVSIVVRGLFEGFPLQMQI